MTLEKTDSLQRPRPPQRVFFARKFEFTTTLSLKECGARLQAADQTPTGCFNPPVFVTVYPEADGLFNLHMSVETRVGKAWIIGNLRAVNASNTHLSGKFGAGAEIVLFAVLQFVLTPVIFYAMLSEQGTGVVIGLSVFLIGLFLVIFWYNLYWARTKFFKIIEQTVEG